MRAVSLFPSGDSNRHNSTLVASSEKSAKLTPAPSHVAPRGKELPGHIFIESSGNSNLEESSSKWRQKRMGSVIVERKVGRSGPLSAIRIGSDRRKRTARK